MSASCSRSYPPPQKTFQEYAEAMQSQSDIFYDAKINVRVVHQSTENQRRSRNVDMTEVERQLFQVHIKRQLEFLVIMAYDIKRSGRKSGNHYRLRLKPSDYNSEGYGVVSHLNRARKVNFK